jgi:hypothetical protein
MLKLTQSSEDDTRAWLDIEWRKRIDFSKASALRVRVFEWCGFYNTATIAPQTMQLSCGSSEPARAAGEPTVQ